MLRYDLPSKKYRESVDLPLEFTSPILYGFSLTDKLWCKFQIRIYDLHDQFLLFSEVMFDVDNVKNFKWSDEPINNLVLPPTTKSLVKALVERHAASNHSFDDFVNGKGQGLVMNLFGNPGVGKTLTAEATSERKCLNLHYITISDFPKQFTGFYNRRQKTSICRGCRRSRDVRTRVGPGTHAYLQSSHKVGRCRSH